VSASTTGRPRWAAAINGWIEFPPPAKLSAIVTWVNFARERMAYILNVVDATLGIPLLFERQNRKQEIDVALNAARAIGAPGPKLWADVVDHFQSATVK